MIFYDSETYPIKPGLQAPLVVCSQWEFGDESPHIHLAHQTGLMLEGALQSGLIVGHNIAYDAACAGATFPDLLPLIFDAYASDRITCTMLRERLNVIARDQYAPALGLVDCLDRHKIPHNIDKSDPWRLRYAELKDTPPEHWPEDARRYALNDVRHGHALFAAQESPYLEDQFRQARAGFWLYLITCWGIRTDPRAVHAFAEQIEEENEELKRHLIFEGLVRPNGVKNQKAARDRLARAYRSKGEAVPETAKGNISLKADACAGAGDPVLDAYARYTSIGSLRGRAKRLLAAHPYPVQPRYTTILETGRTSCSAGKTKKGARVKSYGDQIHNMDRKPGPRECYVPRDGCVFISVDWSGAELHALAQACIDKGLHSTLGEKLNAGLDVHWWFACQMKGLDYDSPVDKDARQFAKIGNFGLPGGLGAATLVTWARVAYGYEMTLSQAEHLKREWLRAFPEMNDYFRIISNEDIAGVPAIMPRSRRYRGAPSYCARANGYFQGTAADMLKDAGFEIARRCYVGDLAPMRLVNEIHDEFITETPERLAHDHAIEVVKEMEAAGRRWFPDCPPKAEPAIMRRWRKSAGPVYDATGRLIPYEDRPLEGEMWTDPDTKEKTPVLEKIRTGLDKGRSPIRVSWEFGIEEERCERLMQAI